MDEFISNLSLLLSGGAAAVAIVKSVAALVRRWKRRKRQNTVSQLALLTELVVEGIARSNADAQQMRDLVDTGFRQTRDDVAELRNDVRNWSFQLFTLDALRRLFTTQRPPEEAASESSPETGEHEDEGSLE